MTPDLTICRTHSGSLLPKPMSDGFFCFNRSMMVQDIGPCDPVPMKWSGDGVALLAIKECAVCDGKGEFATASTQPTADGFPTATIIACRRCGEKGWEYEARIVSGKGRYDIKGDSYNEGWADALDATDTDRVAVVALTKEER